MASDVLVPAHWSTISKYIDQMTAPKWVKGDDFYRVGAYDAYDGIYLVNPNAGFKISIRGQEGEPIFVPSGRKVVETAQRFCAPQMAIFTDPTFGDATQQQDATLWMNDFTAREDVYSRFSMNKRRGLIRGDWLWHLIADPALQQGARVSMLPLNPATYFPETVDGDPSMVIAVHLAEVTMFDKDPAIRKTVYRKESGTSGPSTITVEEMICKPTAWGQPGVDMDLEVLQSLRPVEQLPAPIDALPVYHIPNGSAEGLWGYSEMQGIERMMAGINQSVTDEDLALALEGLGVYVSDAGAPVDEEGNTLPWTVAPARVIEVPKDHKFERVTGLTTVSPMQDHLGYLHSQIDDVTGTNDVTRGTADVAVAESGVALSIRMAPLLNRMGEKELTISGVMDQLLFGLRNWFDAYEGTNFQDIRWDIRYGDPMPKNKTEVFNQVMAMYTAVPPLISGTEARRMLMKVGWDFTDETALVGEILQETQNFAAVQADAVASRLNGEVTALNA